jgi:protein-tyrosine phosphatase
MRAEMYEIIPCPAGRLATMPRPREGQWLKGEIASLQAAGVTDLVSMLTISEEVEIGLVFESDLCAEFGLRFHRYSLPDRSVPLQPAFDDFVATLLPVLQLGGFIAIHCRAGIGRSSVLAAGFLCALGLPAREALRLISNARGFDVPDTDEQYDFILSLDGPRARSA